MSRIQIVLCDRLLPHGNCAAHTPLSLAKSAGWALTPTGDYCPRHKADRGPDRGRRARRSA